MKLALMEGDYEVLRRFQGRSSLRTYLLAVVQRLLLDRNRRAWGKWRPSALARRLGPLALRLEELLCRDGLAVEDACETLRAQGRATEPIATLRELAQRLPARTPRRTDSLEDGNASLRMPSNDSPYLDLQTKETAARCQAALQEAVAALPPEDRILVRLRFEDGLSTAAMARTLAVDQKRLYRRLESALAALRQHLLTKGIAWEEVATLIETGGCHLLLLGVAPETGWSRPSHEEATS